MQSEERVGASLRILGHGRNGRRTTMWRRMSPRADLALKSRIKKICCWCINLSRDERTHVVVVRNTYHLAFALISRPRDGCRLGFVGDQLGGQTSTTVTLTAVSGECILASISAAVTSPGPPSLTLLSLTDGNMTEGRLCEGEPGVLTKGGSPGRPFHVIFFCSTS